MRKINLVSMAIVVLLAVAFLTGCKPSKDVKIKDLIDKYAKETANEMYYKVDFIVVGSQFKDFEYTIEPIDMKIANTKAVGDLTYHFVKCKIKYECRIIFI